MSQTQTYQVRGMTCGHCARAVTAELEALDRVTGVIVDVVPQGDSAVIVTSSADRQRPGRQSQGPPTH
jgi:copper chaperone CopZ